MTVKFDELTQWTAQLLRSGIPPAPVRRLTRFVSFGGLELGGFVAPRPLRIRCVSAPYVPHDWTKRRFQVLG